MAIFWVVVFCICLALLVKGADIFLNKAETIGYSLGISPFIVGVAIVGFGTSLPELVSSIAGVLQGAPEIVMANVVGSNIANILLIIGISAMIARKLVVTKDIIDLDLPLLGLTTVLLIGVAYDRVVTVPESILLLIAYGIYFWYVVTDKAEAKEGETEIVVQRKKVKVSDVVVLIGGLALLVVSAKYLIEAVIALSEIFNIGAGIIAITVVAVGTSLPELIVSIKAALQKKSDVAIGNIVGSNVFNGLFVVGIPGIFGALPIDDKTGTIGLVGLAVATSLLIVSGISKRLYGWEGVFYVMLYILFTAKLLELF